MNALNSQPPCNPIELPSKRPLLMGIVNVTPDSFSDGGRFKTIDEAIAFGLKLSQDGADVIDVGGESTRPGSDPVPVQEELDRVVPIVAALASEGLAVSVDTRKPPVALECLKVGARMVNDIYALQAPTMPEICAEWGCTVCVMHMKGEPKTMQTSPEYSDVIEEVCTFLASRVIEIESAGVQHDQIWIDPGIGFGKTIAHNLDLLRSLDRVAAMGHPVLLGVSRKSFLGRLTGVDDPTDRLEATLAAEVIGVMKGARIIRTHNVRASKRALAIAAAVSSVSQPPL